MDLRPQITVLLGAQSATMLLRLPRTHPVAEYEVELIFLLLIFVTLQRMLCYRNITTARRARGSSNGERRTERIKEVAQIIHLCYDYQRSDSSLSSKDRLNGLSFLL